MGKRLLASIPHERLKRYVALSAKYELDPYLLYRWNQKVSLAIFEEIGVIEVAMRSAMAKELVARYGMNWYKNISILDSQAIEKIRKIPGLEAPRLTPEEAHGKVVASLTLDFWVKLLGAGSYFYHEDKNTKIKTKYRRIYDELLWKPALRLSFPFAGDLERSKVESLARNMRLARNRIAHHEHVIWGIPAVGQIDPNTREVKRIRIQELKNGMLDLAGLLDPKLEDWLLDNSTLATVIRACPLPSMDDLHI